MALLTFNLMVVVWSVEKAEWVEGPNLVGLIILSMLTALALAKAPRCLPFSLRPRREAGLKGRRAAGLLGIVALPLGLVIGLWVVIVQLTSFQGETIDLESAQQLGER